MRGTQTFGGGSVTTFNCTLRSGYSLPTWGQCTGVRIGNVVIINVWGLRADAAHIGETIFAETPYRAANTAGALLSADDQTSNAVMRSSADSTALYLSKYTTANKYMYGQLVYAVQE